MADGINVAASLTFNRLPELSLLLHEQASKGVRKTAFDIQQAAQANAAVETGAMKNAVYVVTSEDSDYSQQTGAAAAMNPKAEVLDEVEKPSDDLTAYVAEGMDYGAYQEYGTSRMAAQPYMTPAAEGERGNFEAAMSSLLS